MADWQIDTILWLQSARIPWVDALMWVPNVLGSPPFFGLATSVLFVVTEKRRAVTYVFILAIMFALMATLKDVFDHVRPFHALGFEPLYGLPGPSSASFPSGHAMCTAGFWSLVALNYRKRWLHALAAGLTVVVGFSRVYAGVHWPQDVLVGGLLGYVIVYLLYCLAGPNRVAEKMGPGDSVLPARGNGFVVACAVTILCICVAISEMAAPFLGLGGGMALVHSWSSPAPCPRQWSWWRGYASYAILGSLVWMAACYLSLPRSPWALAVAYGGSAVWLAGLWPQIHMRMHRQGSS